MWLLERCRKEWTDAPTDYGQLFDDAMKVIPFRSIINPDDPMFANPSNMQEAIQQYCRNTSQPVPEGYAEITRCILESLALRYKQVFNYLTEMASFPIEVLHVIGGGSRNAYLNQFTANATGAEILAGPTEGTALGNIMVQAWSEEQKTGFAPLLSHSQASRIWDLRRIIANSLELKHFAPQDKAEWDAAYKYFLEIIQKAK